MAVYLVGHVPSKLPGPCNCNAMTSMMADANLTSKLTLDKKMHIFFNYCDNSSTFDEYVNVMDTSKYNKHRVNLLGIFIGEPLNYQRFSHGVKQSN